MEWEGTDEKALHSPHPGKGTQRSWTWGQQSWGRGPGQKRPSWHNWIGAQLPEPTSWLACQALACPDHRTVGVPGTPTSGRAEIKSVLFTTPAT